MFSEQKVADVVTFLAEFADSISTACNQSLVNIGTDTYGEPMPKLNQVMLRFEIQVQYLSILHFMVRNMADNSSLPVEDVKVFTSMMRHFAYVPLKEHGIDWDFAQKAIAVRTNSYLKAIAANWDFERIIDTLILRFLPWSINAKEVEIKLGDVVLLTNVSMSDLRVVIEPKLFGSVLVVSLVLETLLRRTPSIHLLTDDEFVARVRSVVDEKVKQHRELLTPFPACVTNERGELELRGDRRDYPPSAVDAVQRLNEHRQKLYSIFLKHHAGDAVRAEGAVRRTVSSSGLLSRFWRALFGPSSPSER